jgi:hypothetical protein
VRVDNTLHICKADACAFKLILSMETLEYAKELASIFHIKANSISSNGKGEFNCVRD